MNTLCGTVLRTNSTRIRNYADSDGETATGGNFSLSYGAPRNILYRATYNLATGTKIGY